MKNLVTMTISVRAAIQEVDERNGIVTLAIPARILTSTEIAMLDSLFPNFPIAVEQLLAKEALLQSVK